MNRHIVVFDKPTVEWPYVTTYINQVQQTYLLYFSTSLMSSKIVQEYSGHSERVNCLLLPDSPNLVCHISTHACEFIIFCAFYFGGEQ